MLGQHGSCSSAQLPVELSENMLPNLFHNLPPQTVVRLEVPKTPKIVMFLDGPLTMY